MTIELNIILSATYTSVWEDVGEVSTICAISTSRAQIQDIQATDDVEGCEILISECVDVFMGNEWHTFEAEGGDFTLESKELFKAAFNSIIKNAIENSEQ